MQGQDLFRAFLVWRLDCRLVVLCLPACLPASRSSARPLQSLYFKLYCEADGLSLSVHAVPAVQCLAVLPDQSCQPPLHLRSQDDEMKFKILDLMCLEGFLKILLLLQENL